MRLSNFLFFFLKGREALLRVAGLTFMNGVRTVRAYRRVCQDALYFPYSCPPVSQGKHISDANGKKRGRVNVSPRSDICNPSTQGNYLHLTGRVSEKSNIDGILKTCIIILFDSLIM